MKLRLTAFVIALNHIWDITSADPEVPNSNDSGKFELTKEDEELLNNISLVMHRNGEPKECGRNNPQEKSIYQSINMIMDLMKMETNEEKQKVFENKYSFESTLSAVSVHVLPSDSCAGNNEELRQSCANGIASYCDSGDDRTPELPDHKELRHISCATGKLSLPCHFHTREGRRITSMSMLLDLVKGQKEGAKQCEESSEEQCKASSDGSELHLYAVPAGRVFMFAASHVGETFDLSHVGTNDDENTMSLEVLSLNPRIFEVKNFFTSDEADGIVDQLMSEGRTSHKLQRSTTGSDADKQENNRRTSESGFVTDGTAMPIKERSFSLLGFDEYYESFADGLQVLRYNESKAYTPHHDYFSGYFPNDYHDYDSTHVGTNRFATILLYMNGVGKDGQGEAIEGGETVFPDVTPEGSLSKEQALEEIRSKYTNVIRPNSWEERLVVTCKTKLSIRPSYAKAILFYSQNPDGMCSILVICVKNYLIGKFSYNFIQVP